MTMMLRMVLKLLMIVFLMMHVHSIGLRKAILAPTVMMEVQGPVTFLGPMRGEMTLVPTPGLP